MRYSEWCLKKAQCEYTIWVHLAHESKKFYCQRDKIMYAYDECLVSETSVLECKESPIPDAKLKLLMHFKMHYNIRL